MRAPKQPVSKTNGLKIVIFQNFRKDHPFNPSFFRKVTRRFETINKNDQLFSKFLKKLVI